MNQDTAYLNLEITATQTSTEIWLGDNAGYFVVKGNGRIKEGLLAGNYVVEFGLGTTCFPIALEEDKCLTQVELEASPTCARPTFNVAQQ